MVVSFLPWQSVQCWDRRGKEIVFVKLIIAVLGFLTQTETVFFCIIFYYHCYHYYNYHYYCYALHAGYARINNHD